jgi:hypothetical protein
MEFTMFEKSESSVRRTSKRQLERSLSRKDISMRFAGGIVALFALICILLITGCGGTTEPTVTFAVEANTDYPPVSEPLTWYPDADGDGYVDLFTPILASEQPDGYFPCSDETCADCDDSDPDVYDTCEEYTCQETSWYLDADGDGYVDPLTSITACDQPAGYLPCLTTNCEDCDDSNPDVHDTCGGAVEETCQATTWYPDADGDGFGDPANSIDECEQPVGYVAAGTDCDDNDPVVGEECFQSISDGNDYDLDRDGILDSLETYLMNEFAPIVWLYSTDPYRPASVEWLFQRDDAALVDGARNILFKPIEDGANLLGFENYGADLLIDMIETPGPNSIYLGDMTSAPYYVTVARDIANRKFAINYWFFYTYNGCGYDGAGVKYCNWTHEGDWEHITLFVEQKPDETYGGLLVNFYYHGIQASYSWKDVHKGVDNEANRVLAFSALYTHATYYQWGKHDTCVKKDALGTCWVKRRDYTNNGFAWDPLKGIITDNAGAIAYQMDLPQGGIINVGQRPLTYSRDYFDPSMGAPMPSMEWILFEGRWGADGNDPPGPGTPDFQWYKDQPGNPPAVWKAPDQQAETGVPTTFDLGRIIFFGAAPISIQVDWGDGSTSNLLSGSSASNIQSEHTYTAPGDYFVEVIAVEKGLWGGNVFKVTVSP